MANGIGKSVRNSRSRPKRAAMWGRAPIRGCSNPRAVQSGVDAYTSRSPTQRGENAAKTSPSPRIQRTAKGHASLSSLPILVIHRRKGNRISRNRSVEGTPAQLPPRLADTPLSTRLPLTPVIHIRTQAKRSIRRWGWAGHPLAIHPAMHTEKRRHTPPDRERRERAQQSAYSTSSWSTNSIPRPAHNDNPIPIVLAPPPLCTIN
ncbi:hypothetical protein R3P38DRAFT_2794899 [Favolaschia claudopus]|uniref:Uncharacterized protein n=1 Tax=Favolaschia claudopus TaxID=2862362 RepID=A0AAW0A918_9AGAR